MKILPSERGRAGEAAACAFLRGKGYRIVERNWSCRFGELDIVARDGDVLAVVEVKLRRSDKYGGPEAAISQQKRQRIAAATRMYLAAFACDLPVRFDVVTLCKGRIHLYRDAFPADR